MGADRGVGSRIFTGSGVTNDFWRQPARVRDSVNASKPTGAVNIDGITPIVNGDRVLFTNLSGGEAGDNNKVFRAVESGGLVTSWNLDTDGQPNGSPQDGNIIYIKEGTTHGDKIYKWTGSGWSEVGGGGGALSAGGSGAVQFSNGIGGFSADTTNFFWDNTNKRLGINTNAPAQPLEVAGPTSSLQLGIALFKHANDTQGVHVGFSGISKYTTNGSNDLYIDGALGTGGSVILAANSGNVGIGGSPNTKLHVRITGSGIASRFQTTTSQGVWLNFTDGFSYNNVVGVENSTGTAIFGSGLGNALTLGTDGPYAVAIHAQGGAPKMTILPSGNVGIGLTNPSHRLHVVVPNGTAYALHGQMSAGELGIRLDANANVAVMGVISSGRVFFGSQNPTTVEIRVNNVERWRWDTSGHFFPLVNNSYDLGTASSQYLRSGYFGTGIVVGTSQQLVLGLNTTIWTGETFSTVVRTNAGFGIAVYSQDTSSGSSNVFFGSGANSGTSGGSGRIRLWSGNVTNAGAAGATGEIHIKTGNNAGTAAGRDSGNITLETGTVVGGTRGTIRLVDGSLAGASNGWVWTLQDNTTGRGAWVAAGGGGGTPGGADTAVQFNNAGVFGGDATNFSWDNTNKVLSVGSTAVSTAQLRIFKANGSIIQTQAAATSQQFWTMLDGANYQHAIGSENSIGTGLFGSGIPYGLSIGTVGNHSITFHTNNATAARMTIGTTGISHSVDIAPNAAGTRSLGSGSLQYAVVHSDRFSAGDGTAANAAFRFASAPGTGFSSNGTVNIHFGVNGTFRALMTASNFTPFTTGGLTLGGLSLRWANVYADGFSSVGASGGAPFACLDAVGNNYLYFVASLTTPSGVANSGGIYNGASLAGALTVMSVNNATADATATRDVRIETGNKTAGTGNSGNIYLQTGTSAGGSRGNIFFNVSSLTGSSVGWVWTLQDTATGRGAWAAAGGGGTPGGADTAVQFNNAGVFGGDETNFFWNNTTKALTIGTTSTSANRLALATGNGSIMSTTSSATVQHFWTLNNTTTNAFIGLESSSGTGIIGTGFTAPLVLTTTTNSNIVFGTNNAPRVVMTTSAFYPTTNDGMNLGGGLNNRWGNLYANIVWAYDGTHGLAVRPSIAGTETTSGSLPFTATRTAMYYFGGTQDLAIVTLNSSANPTSSIFISTGSGLTTQPSGSLNLVTGLSNGSGATGAVNISSGSSSSTGNSGAVNISTGTSTGGTRGEINFNARNYTFNGTTNTAIQPASNNTLRLGDNGRQFIYSYILYSFSNNPIDANHIAVFSSNLGSLGSFTTGQGVGAYGFGTTYPLLLATENRGGVDAIQTLGILLKTGNKTAGTGDSGSITLQTGTSAGGNRGAILFNERSLPSAANGYIWKLADSTTGRGAWSIPTQAAKISVTGPLSGYSGGPTLIPFTVANAVFNTGSIIGTNQMDVQETGYYTVVAKGTSPTNLTTEFILLYYQVNAGPITPMSSLQYGNAGAFATTVGAVQLSLTAGDAVKLYAFAIQDQVQGIEFSLAKH